MDNRPMNNESVLRHVVLMAFKPESGEEGVRRVEQAFREMVPQISEIVDYEWGTNVSIEGKAQGFTHCFLLTFRDEAGRNAYLPHPAHVALGHVLRPYLDKVLVIDYWTRR